MAVLSWTGGSQRVLCRTPSTDMAVAAAMPDRTGSSTGTPILAASSSAPDKHRVAIAVSLGDGMQQRGKA